MSNAPNKVADRCGAEARVEGRRLPSTGSAALGYGANPHLLVIRTTLQGDAMAISDLAHIVDTAVSQGMAEAVAR